MVRTRATRASSVMGLPWRRASRHCRSQKSMSGRMHDSCNAQGEVNHPAGSGLAALKALHSRDPFFCTASTVAASYHQTRAFMRPSPQPADSPAPTPRALASPHITYPSHHALLECWSLPPRLRFDSRRSHSWTSDESVCFI
jgi:hypothetical protein